MAHESGSGSFETLIISGGKIEGAPLKEHRQIFGETRV